MIGDLWIFGRCDVCYVVKLLSSNNDNLHTHPIAVKPPIFTEFDFMLNHYNKSGI